MNSEKVIFEILELAYMKGLPDIEATPLCHEMKRHEVTIYLNHKFFLSLMRSFQGYAEVGHQAFDFYRHPEKMGGYKVFIVVDESHPDYVIHAVSGDK